jgi:hypothetical protein
MSKKARPMTDAAVGLWDELYGKIHSPVYSYWQKIFQNTIAIASKGRDKRIG